MAEHLTVDTLKQNMGDGFKLLAAAEVDKTAAFLSGAATSAFVSNGAVGGALTAGATSAAAVTGLGINAKDIAAMYAQLPQQLLDIAMQVATEELQKIIADTVAQITQILTSIPTQILAATAKATQENLVPFDECLSKARKDPANQAEEAQKKSEKEQENKTKEKAEKAKNDISKKITEITDKITQYVTLATQYISEGPAIVTDAMNKAIDMGLQEAYKFQAEQIATVKKSVDEFCKKAGEGAGKTAAQKINKQQEKAAKKIVAKENKAKQKVKTKADAAKQSAKLKIFAKLGV